MNACSEEALRFIDDSLFNKLFRVKQALCLVENIIALLCFTSKRYILYPPAFIEDYLIQSLEFEFLLKLIILSLPLAPSYVTSGTIRKSDDVLSREGIEARYSSLWEGLTANYARISRFTGASTLRLTI